MKLQAKNISLFFQEARHTLMGAWRTFLLTPAHYWKQTLVLFAILLITLIFADAFIFWQYFIVLDRNTATQQEGTFSLNTKTLDAALTVLRNREQRFEEARQKAAFPDVFPAPPQE